MYHLAFENRGTKNRGTEKNPEKTAELFQNRGTFFRYLESIAFLLFLGAAGAPGKKCSFYLFSVFPFIVFEHIRHICLIRMSFKSVLINQEIL